MNLIIILRMMCMRIPFLRKFLGMPLELYIIRHPESKRNESLNGRLHLPEDEITPDIDVDHRVEITQLGNKQVKTTAQGFPKTFGCVPDVVIHSGYRRTERATEVLTFHWRVINENIQTEEDIGLRERESGYTYFMSEEKIAEHFPFLKTYWPKTKGLFARPVGGESLIDVVERRLRWVIQKVWKRHAGKRVCFVTHGRTIQCLRFILDGMNWEDMETFLSDPKNHSDNCGITVYHYDPKVGKLILKDWNVVLY